MQASLIHALASGPSHDTVLLPAIGYLRLPQIIGRASNSSALAIPALIPVSKSTWWAGVRSGRFPKPVKLGERITAWRVEDIRALVEAGPLQ
jgi:prophage regulatory protein